MWRVEEKTLAKAKAKDEYCLQCGVHIAPAASERREVTDKGGSLEGVVHDGRCTAEYIAKAGRGIQVGPPSRMLMFGRVAPVTA